MRVTLLLLLFVVSALGQSVDSPCELEPEVKEASRSWDHMDDAVVPYRERYERRLKFVQGLLKKYPPRHPGPSVATAASVGSDVRNTGGSCRRIPPGSTRRIQTIPSISFSMLPSSPAGIAQRQSRFWKNSSTTYPRLHLLTGPWLRSINTRLSRTPRKQLSTWKPFRASVLTAPLGSPRAAGLTTLLSSSVASHGCAAW